jgi:ATP-dependent DNA helicase RecG
MRILPTSIEIISYSGIDPSLKQADFEKGVIRTRRYRNRRVGSFLKELGLTEGKGTGIPIIYRELKTNNSPAPIFDTDIPNRTFFVVEIPISHNFNDTENNVGNNVGNNIDDISIKIINQIAQNPLISINKLALLLNLSGRTIERKISKLQKMNYLKRIGGTRGYWQIIKTNQEK